MWKHINFEKCLSHINSHAAAEVENRSTIKPSITISRMCGAGGRSVACQLAEYLQSRHPTGRAWTIFDKKLIEKVLEEHHLSKRIAEFLPEGHKSLVAEMIEKMRGLHPPTSTLVEHTAETIWHLAEGGHVILVGRAANLITGRLDNVFHVRLVGSLEKRVSRVEEVFEMSRNDARKFVQSQDAAKRIYMQEHFGRDIDDALLYHLIINTDDISCEHTAQLIGDAVIRHFKLSSERH